MCLKEPARKRKGDDFVTPGRFLCCNAARFHADVVRRTWRPARERGPDLGGIALLVAALACCGCDFLADRRARART